MGSKVMVCVTRQKTCARLIDLGARLAKSRNAALLVVHAIRPLDTVLGSADESEALEALFALATSSGGEMSMLRADDVAGALVRCAKEQNADLIVLGASPKTEPVSFSTRLRNQLPDTEIITVDADSFDTGIHISMSVDNIA